jgi:DNA-binding HxlR family transcriptional regulator
MEDGTSKSPRHTGVTVAELDQPAGFQNCDSVTPEDHCRVREILDRVADKWSLLVIALLAERGRRFSELRSEIDGISQRMLTLTLRRLERDGLVRRTVHPVVPPRVDYALTPLGATLIDPIEALVQWTFDHKEEIKAARAAYAGRENGAPTD